MSLAIRRWWAWITHRHDWVVIHRFEFTYEHSSPFFSYKEQRMGRLERCTCGQERAKQWAGDHWKRLDLDFVNENIARQTIAIPARHQE